MHRSLVSFSDYVPFGGFVHFIKNLSEILDIPSDFYKTTDKTQNIRKTFSKNVREK